MLEALAVGARTSEPTAGRGPRRRPAGARRDRRRVAQRRLRRHRRPAERSTAQVVRGAARHASRGRDLSRLIDGTARTTAGAGPQRGAAAGPDHATSTRRWRRFAVRGRQPARLGRRAARRRSRPPNRALASLNAAFPPTRAFAREILPGVRETPATIQAGASRGSSRRGRCSGPRSSAAWRASSRRRRARPRAAHRRVARRSCRRPTLAARCARDVVLPTGDVVIQDEFTDRRRELQGVLLRARRPRRRGPELRRQRHVRALPDGRRRADVSLGLHPRRTRRAVRQRCPVPLGTRPRLPGHAARLTGRTRPAHKQRAGPQRPGGRQGAATVRPRGAAGARAAVAAGELRPFGTAGRAAMSTAIRKHLRDFAAILGLFARRRRSSRR